MRGMKIVRQLRWLVRAALAASLLAAPLGAEETKNDEEVRIERLERALAETRVQLAAAQAQGAENARFAEIERRIDLLAAEIEKLKLGEAAVPPGESAQRGLGPAASKVYALPHGVSIGGYGEAVYRNFDSRTERGDAVDQKDTIDLERAVFYFGYKFDPTLVFNSEIEYEHAVAASDKEGEVEVEFAYVDWVPSREWSLRGGLLLVPMGFINELHEPTVYLGTARPDVESVILPSTWRELGLGVTGESGPLAYRAFLVNGLKSSGYDAEEGIREGRQEGSLATAEDWAITARLDWTPVPGAIVGASIFSSDSAQGAVTPSGKRFDGRTTVYDLHAEWRARGLQLRGLWAGSRIGDAAAIDEANGYEGEDSIGSRQEGWYAEAGFDVFSLGEPGRSSLIPFVRYESFDTQKKVPAGYDRNPANDVDSWTVGVSWKPIENVVLKSDWKKVKTAARTGVDRWSLALGYIF